MKLSAGAKGVGPGGVEMVDQHGQRFGAFDSLVWPTPRFRSETPPTGGWATKKIALTLMNLDVNKKENTCLPWYTLGVSLEMLRK